MLEQTACIALGWASELVFLAEHGRGAVPLGIEPAGWCDTFERDVFTCYVFFWVCAGGGLSS